MFPAIPDETEFVTFIQEPKFYRRGPGDEGYLPAMAVFVVKSPWPGRPQAPHIVTHGTVEKRHFDQSEAERKHFVSLKEDPAIVIFAAVLKVHLATLENLRELIH